MSKEIVITLPDRVYRQVQQISRVEQRPLNDVIEEALTKAFPPVSTRWVTERYYLAQEKALTKAFPSVHVNPQRAKMKEEQAAFQAMKPDLLRRYEGQYVAIHNGELVDYDSDQTTLALRINDQYPNTAVLIKKVSPEPDKILHMRSP